MAKGASFHRGTSGSPKHTEVHGSQGFDAGHVGPDGPRIGAGVEGRKVNPEVNKSGSSGRPGVKGMKRYSSGE